MGMQTFGNFRVVKNILINFFSYSTRLQ